MVLLIVDTQKLITTEKIYNYDLFVQNVAALIAKARQNDIEVIFIRHDDGTGQALTMGTDGFEIFEGFKPLENEKIFDKYVNSPFRDTGLIEYLKDEKEIMVAGLQTDYCVDATVKCGFEHHFRMIVPAYCNSTTDNRFMSAEESYRYYNEFIWNNRFAECISFERAVERLDGSNQE